MMSLPLHQQICLPVEDVEEELMELILRKSNNKDTFKASSQTEKQINNKMLELLNVKTKSLDIQNKSDSRSEHGQSTDWSGELSASHGETAGRKAILSFNPSLILLLRPSTSGAETIQKTKRSEGCQR